MTLTLSELNLAGQAAYKACPGIEKDPHLLKGRANRVRIELTNRADYDGDDTVKRIANCTAVAWFWAGYQVMKSGDDTT